MATEEFIDVEYFKQLIIYYGKLGYKRAFVSALNEFQDDTQDARDYSKERASALEKEKDVAIKIKANLLNLPLPLPFLTGLNADEEVWANGMEYDRVRQNTENGTNVNMHDYCEAVIAKWNTYNTRKHLFDSAVTEWVKYTQTLFNNAEYSRLQQMFDLMEALPSDIDATAIATLRTQVNSI